MVLVAPGGVHRGPPIGRVAVELLQAPATGLSDDTPGSEIHGRASMPIRWDVDADEWSLFCAVLGAAPLRAAVGRDAGGRARQRALPEAEDLDAEVDGCPARARTGLRAGGNGGSFGPACSATRVVLRTGWTPI